MTRRQRNWTIALGGLTAAIVAGVLLFDWNWFKPLVEARASLAAGRAVRIGNLDVEFGRAPRIVIERITVANPSEFPAGSLMAEVERMAMRIELWPLFRGHVRMPELTVDRPIATLEPGPSGVPNWQLPSGEGGTPPEIQQLTINDGKAKLRHPKLKVDVDLAIHTEPDPKGGQSQVVITGKGKYADAPTRIDLRAGSLLYLRQAEIRYPVSFTWTVGETQVKLTGTVHNPSNFAGLDGTLDLKGPDLDKLYTLIRIPLPPSPPYHIAGKISYTDRQVRFERFSGTLGGSDLSGNLKVDTGGERLRMDGELSSEKVLLEDLAGFIGAVPGKEGTAPPPRPVKGKAGKPPAESAERTRERQQAKEEAGFLPTNPINLEKLNTADVHVTYRGKRIETENIPLDNLNARLDLENGRLRLHPLNFGIGEGTIAMNLDIDGRAAPPKVAGDIDFRNVDLHRIMRETKMFEGQGRIGGRAKIVSTGQSLAEIMAHGDGALALAMTGGSMSAILVELTGLDIGEALGLSVADPKKQYPIRCMVLDSDLQQGVLKPKVLVIDTTDTNIIGHGAIDFRTEAVRVRLEPHPKDVSILTFRTPIDIGGTLKHPNARPDIPLTVGRIAAMVGLGVVATPVAALIPTIELGLGKDSDCVGLTQQAQGKVGELKQQPARKQQKR
jgi:AsmA family protein